MTRYSFEIKRWARWLGTFIGFPLAGVTARLVAGNIDDLASAALGGLAGGAVLGAVQAVVGGLDRTEWVRWTAATAGGLAVGLTVGAGTVGFATDTASLMVVGGISGACVGIAQAVSVSMRSVDRILWALATPVLWAGAWWVTLHVIVDADRQHASFGSSGAVVASALAGILYAVRQPGPQSVVVRATASDGSAVAS
jgi:hypothetical protein